MKHVIFVSRPLALRIVPTAGAAIISIHASDEDPAPLLPGWQACLTLCFDDIDEPRRGAIAFDAEMARRIVEFVDAQSERKTLYVHCTAGISRSAAVAIFISEAHGHECHKPGFGQAVSAGNWPHYNKRVYRALVDAELAKIDRLTSALRDRGLRQVFGTGYFALNAKGGPARFWLVAGHVGI